MADHEHEVDHDYCDFDDHIRRRDVTFEDCPLIVCAVCGQEFDDENVT